MSGTFIVNADYVLNIASRINGARGSLGDKEKAQNDTTEAIAQVEGLSVVLDCATKFDNSLSNLQNDLGSFSTLTKAFANSMSQKDDVNIKNFEAVHGYMRPYTGGDVVSVSDNLAQAESGAFQNKMNEELNAYNPNQEKQVTGDNQEIPIEQPEENSVIEKTDIYSMADEAVNVDTVDPGIDINREKLFGQNNGNNTDVNHQEGTSVIGNENLYQQDTAVSALQTHNFDSQTSSKNMGNPYATGQYQSYDYEKNQGEGKEKIEYLYDFDNKQYVVNHYSEDGNTLIKKVVIDPVSGNVINETSFDEV